MKIAMIRANVEEEREVTMACFLASLNEEITNVIELHHYIELEEMVNMTMKVEKQLKFKSTSKSSYSNSTINWNSSSQSRRRRLKTSQMKRRIRLSQKVHLNLLILLILILKSIGTSNSLDVLVIDILLHNVRIRRL